MLEVTFVGVRARANGAIDYRFTLAGAHAGRPLDVWVNNIRQDARDFGPITHAVEPNFILAQAVLDTYSARIADVLGMMFRA